MSVAALPAPAPHSSAARGQEDYADWLGATQREDAEQSIAALSSVEPEWLIVDHYGLDAQWEQALQPYCRRLAVIDDLANRAHECNLLLDQNQSLRAERYAGLVPAACRLLLGPRYALLQEEYARYRRDRRRDAGVERVFVFFGGSDPRNLTGIAVAALACQSLRHLRVDVVVGANNPHREQLQKQAADRAGVTIHGPRPHLADLMAQADLAIGAAGTTTWERMCLGLPSLVVSIAENQRPVAEALAQEGMIRYVGAAGNVGVAELIAAIESAIVSAEELSEQSLRGALLVDGLGAMRVAECMDPTGPEHLRLRPARASDAALYFAWVNDPEARRQALNTAAIAWSEHRQWFRARIADARSQLFVLEAKSLPVGQIRFDAAADEMRIDYSIDAQFRGRGWGRRLVALGMQRLSERGRIVFRAEVRTSNRPSAAIFARLGFVGSTSVDRSDLEVFRFDTGLSTAPETH